MREQLNTATASVLGLSKLTFIIILLFALIGIAVSVELTFVHHSTHTDNKFSSMCAVNDRVNCETVARSPYSVFLGAPVSVWGILGYFLIGLFSVWGLQCSKYNRSWPLGVLTVLAFFALCTSGFLAYISFTKIDSICLFCMTLYVIAILLTVWMSVTFIKFKLNPVKVIYEDIKSLLSRPFHFAMIAVPTIAVTLAVMFAVPPYWQHIGWKDLPKLNTGKDMNGDHWIGAEKPMLNIIEYSDYQCPYCRNAHRNARIIAAKYPDEVRLVHKHVPLDKACNKSIVDSYHTYACKFSKATVCASRQGKFWEMNDAIFSIQDSIRAVDVNVEHLAVELGLDRLNFVSCMEEKDFPKDILRNIEESERLQIAGTPTFIIHGQEFEGSVSEAFVANYVEQMRKKHTERKSGTSTDE